MAVNLKKNGDALRAAWKDVLDIKTPTNWAVFGYEGQTNDLEVVATGDEGIEEMAEELNSGKVMYAFLKVDDPKTTLPKNVLINWQGEGANIVRKGTCANHVRDISNFFSGAHVTLNARNDEEVEPQIIIEKVAKSSGSSYSFNTRTEVIESQKPVGTNYQRVNPVQEINAQERNQFWLREEQEERKRVEEERKRRESERLKLEQELKRREEVESAGRDVIDEQRNETINRLRLAEKEAIVKENDRKMVLENERLEKELIQDKISSDAQMKKERSQEVQQIIGKNTSNVRSIFEQNTSAGQMLSPTKKGDNGIRSPNKIDTSKFEYEPEIVKTTNAIEPEMENVNDSDDQDQFSTIKRSPKSPNEVVNSENIKNSEIHGNKVISSEKIVLQEEITVAKLPPIVTEQQMVDEILGADMGSDYGLRARALYDYQAADDTEITFDPGDIITHIDQIDEGWWQGLGPDGTFGLFPANYVEVIF